MNTDRHSSSWDKLSLKDKADIMKMAVQKGMYNLDAIRNTYNEFAEGGPEETYTPSPNEPDKIKWFEHWYNNRTQQLADNERHYINVYTPIFDAIRGTILPKDKTTTYFAHKAKNRMLQNLNATEEGVLPSKGEKPNLSEKALHTAIEDVSDYLDKEDRPEDNLYLLSALQKGSYYPRNKVILYAPDAKEGTYIHERTHALQANPQKSAIYKELYKRYKTENLFKEGYKYDKYYDDPSEIYSRLNAARYNLNLDPKEEITKEQLKIIKKNSNKKGGAGNLFDRYNDDFLLYLFNNIADANTSKNLKKSVSAAFGGPLVQLANKYAMGGPENDLVNRVIQEEGFLRTPTNIGDGKMTLGSGLTAEKWRNLYNEKGVWTEEDNRKAVSEELETRRKWAEKDVPNWDKLPQDSQNALLSYKYNFDFNRKNSPKLYKALSEGNYEEAARQMDATSNNPKFKKGLMDRRKREQEWFLSGFNEPETFPDIVNTINQPDNVYTPPQSVLDNIAENNGKYMITGTPPLAGTRIPTSGIADGLAMQDRIASAWQWLKDYNILNVLLGH